MSSDLLRGTYRSALLATRDFVFPAQDEIEISGRLHPPPFGFYLALNRTLPLASKKFKFCCSSQHIYPANVGKGFRNPWAWGATSPPLLRGHEGHAPYSLLALGRCVHMAELCGVNSRSVLAPPRVTSLIDLPSLASLDVCCLTLCRIGRRYSLSLPYFAPPDVSSL